MDACKSVARRLAGLLTLCVFMLGCGGGVRSTIDRLGGDETQRREARSELLIAAQDVVPDLMAAIKNERKDKKIRIEAASVLAEIAMNQDREHAWDAVFETLAHPDPEIAETVAEQIALLLFEGRRHQRERLERRVAEGVADERAGGAMFAVLSRKLFSEDEEERTEAVRRVRRIQDQGFQRWFSEILVAVLDEADPDKSGAAVDAIIELDQPVGISALQARLTDPDIEARASIARILSEKARIVARGAVELSANDYEGRRKVFERAVAYNPFDASVTAMQVDFLEEIGDAAGAEAVMNSKGAFILQWDVVGPFDSPAEAGIDPGRMDLAAEYPSARAATAWTPVHTDSSDGVVDLRRDRAFQRARGAVAAYASLVTARAVDRALIKVNSGYAVEVFLNGESIFSASEEEMALGERWIPAPLPAGENELLIWVTAARPPSFSVRIADSDHNPVTIIPRDSP